MWDPIGVSGIPQARDEYRSYLPRVFSLLIHHAPETELVAFLVTTAIETMGLSGTRAARKHAEEIVSILTDYRDAILKQTIA